MGNPRTTKILSHKEEQHDLSQDRNGPMSIIDPEDVLYDEHGGGELTNEQIEAIMRGE